MKQFNPSYYAKMNNSPTSFTLVAHVPELPVASESHKDKIFFLKTDSCFYHCITIGSEWEWRKVTFGTRRQFILPVTWIVPGVSEYTFNNEVETIRKLVGEMANYDSYFAELKVNVDWIKNGTGATLNKVILVSNDIIEWVNDACGTDLATIPLGSEDTSTPDGATCQELASYLNNLISVLNPHAGFSYEMSRIDNEIARLSGLVNSPYSFVETSDTTPSESKTYYVKEDGYYKLAGTGENPTGKITSFVSGTKYYEVTGGVTVATPQDFNALSATVGELNKEFHTFRSSVSALNYSSAETMTKIQSSVEALSTKITSLEKADKTIVEEYLGWSPTVTGNKPAIIERLDDIEESIDDIYGTLGEGGSGTISGRLATAESAITNINASITDIGATIGSHGSGTNPGSGLMKDVDEAKYSANTAKTSADASAAAVTALTTKLDSLKAVFQSMASVVISDDAGYTEVCSAMRAMKAAAAQAVAILTTTTQEG